MAFKLGSLLSFDPSASQKYAALITYLGTDFCGWQKQSVEHSGALPSVGGALEHALEQMTGEKVAVVGSGRTDSGVHALGQVAHFRLKADKIWNPLHLMRGLNSALPFSIRVLEVRPVPHGFHAQRSATKKQYSYYIQQGEYPLPHLTPTTLWVRRPLNLELMRAELSALVGEHDFKPFQSSGSKKNLPTVRTIESASVEEVSLLQWGGEFRGIRIRLVGTGFLKQMVRGIVGTLVPLGEGRLPVGTFARILKDQDRSLLGPTAAARGLWLERVWYGPEWGEFDILAQLRLEPAPYATSSTDRNPKQNHS